MTAPHSPSPHAGQSAPAAPGAAHRPPLLRWAIWVAIFALIAAAVVCVVWVLVGPENGLIGRAFLTILLLAAFAGVAILETHLAPRRPDWFALTSMVVWVATLLLGAFLIWMPVAPYDYTGGAGRFVSFLAIVLVLQLAVLHVRLFAKALARNVTAFTRTTGFVTIGLVALLAVLLVLPLAFHEFIDFADLYWRIVVAVTILAAVGTALVPLVNALFAPRRERPHEAPGYAPAAPAAGYGQGHAAPQLQGYAPAAQPAAQPWPTFADGATPLPVLADGSPDWNAYYTGYPTQQAAPQHPPIEQPHPPQPPQAGYQGFPPPPPMPPS